MSISTVLSWSDEEIGNMFGSPKEVRKELEKQQAEGNLLIPSYGCEGFDPVKGCPWHEVK